MGGGPRRVAVGIVLGAAVVVAGPATAATDGDDRVTRYDVTITLDDDGVAQVDLVLEVDFGQDPNRGPYLSYVVKQRFDEASDRVYRITDVRASSRTAPDEVHLETRGALLEVRIGDEDQDDLTGVHSYRVTYRVEGWVSSADAFGLEHDELFLNVIGDSWTIPVIDVGVTVVGPGQVQAARCYAGQDAACMRTETEGPTATFAEATLVPGEPLTVAIAYPAGTFGGVEPILQDRWAPGRAFALTPVTGGLAGVVVLVGVGAALRQRRDRRFAGLVAVSEPASGAIADTRRRRSDPTGVRSTPPEGLRPGQLGTLVDGRADARDVTATLVDLAVRGHVTIAEVTEGDWTLTRAARSTDDLLPYERILVDRFFEGRDVVMLSQVAGTFDGTLAEVRTALYDDVTARGWFRADPRAARNRRVTVGVAVLAGGVVVTVALAVWTSFALVGAAVVVVGAAVLATTGVAPLRTARGVAVLRETQAFRRYLEAADPDGSGSQDHLEVFSTHLPFAVAFGLTRRWARVLAVPPTHGRPAAQPTWYVGHGALWATGTFGERIDRFTRSTDAAVIAPPPTPGEGGGTGFTAGSAGAGVGGGGGGTW
ncbi:DUF2207 domain-containing protein [Actinotalea sp. Marseille-Q4924]|uniref:DUF2207 domain-containing protein n=1 Tax=Actinotalea sp. Marseille-Q4924 TaxID=2866571 RepID=UPI001CE41F42|nr:DUF2207 domain-containing protein [Actinotalea sp. Marseille-Q4924]